jgi:hypothetical protein
LTRDRGIDPCVDPAQHVLHAAVLGVEYRVQTRHAAPCRQLRHPAEQPPAGPGGAIGLEHGQRDFAHRFARREAHAARRADLRAIAGSAQRDQRDMVGLVDAREVIEIGQGEMSPGGTLPFRARLIGQRAQTVRTRAVAIAERADNDGATVLETSGHRRRNRVHGGASLAPGFRPGESGTNRMQTALLPPAGKS